MQIAATSAIGCALWYRNTSLIIIVHQEACSPLSPLSLPRAHLLSLCVQPISGSKALNEPKSTAKCHQQQQEQPVQRGSAARGVCGSRGLVVAGAKRSGDAGRVSQSGSLLKCCANFICKLWQKRGLYANLHGKSRQGEREGESRAG